MNTAGNIAEIGQKYKAVMVYSNEKEWKGIQVGDEQYIEGMQATLVKAPAPVVQKSVWAQLPHEQYLCECKPDFCYYNQKTGQILQDRPAEGHDISITAVRPYIFKLVAQPEGAVDSSLYTLLAIEKEENANDILTGPLSWIAAVAIDIPGSVISTMVMLPCSIYSAIFE